MITKIEATNQTSQNFLVSALSKLGYSSIVITDPAWKLETVAQSVMKRSMGEQKCVGIFDTKATGCGGFGLQFPEEVKQDKWNDAFGLLTGVALENDKCRIRFSVIPKSTDYKPATVQAHLAATNECRRCKRRREHVKIGRMEGDIVCHACYEDLLDIMDRLRPVHDQMLAYVDSLKEMIINMQIRYSPKRRKWQEHVL